MKNSTWASVMILAVIVMGSLSWMERDMASIFIMIMIATQLICSAIESLEEATVKRELAHNPPSILAPDLGS